MVAASTVTLTARPDEAVGAKTAEPPTTPDPAALNVMVWAAGVVFATVFAASPTPSWLPAAVQSAASTQLTPRKLRLMAVAGAQVPADSMA